MEQRILAQEQGLVGFGTHVSAADRPKSSLCVVGGGGIVYGLNFLKVKFRLPRQTGLSHWPAHL